MSQGTEKVTDQTLENVDDLLLSGVGISKAHLKQEFDSFFNKVREDAVILGFNFVVTTKNKEEGSFSMSGRMKGDKTIVQGTFHSISDHKAEILSMIFSPIVVEDDE